jgi:hypothetical protein
MIATMILNIDVIGKSQTLGDSQSGVVAGVPMSRSRFGPRFDAIAKRLRREFASAIPVAIRTVDKVIVCEGRKCYGLCVPFVNDRSQVVQYKILISRKISVDFAIYILMHEWGHILDAEELGEPTKHHRANWGKHFAKIWHEIIEKG